MNYYLLTLLGVQDLGVLDRHNNSLYEVVFPWFRSTMQMLCNYFYSFIVAGSILLVPQLLSVGSEPADHCHVV